MSCLQRGDFSASEMLSMGISSSMGRSKSGILRGPDEPSRYARNFVKRVERLARNCSYRRHRLHATWAGRIRGPQGRPGNGTSLLGGGRYLPCLDDRPRCNISFARSALFEAYWRRSPAAADGSEGRSPCRSAVTEWGNGMGMGVNRDRPLHLILTKCSPKCTFE